MLIPDILPWSLFLLFFPALTRWGEKRYKPLRWLGAMTICYLVGLLLGNQPWIIIPADFLNTVMEASVSLAIPAMLFTANPRQLLSTGKQGLLAFGFAALSAILAATLAYFIAGASLENSANISGMLASVYTGGTPNMSAVGLALDVEHELFLVLNSADIILSGLYFGFLLTIGPALLGKILKNNHTPTADSSTAPLHEAIEQMPDIKDVAFTLLLSAILLGVAAGISLLTFDKLVVPVFILLVTAFSLLTAGNKKVQQINGSYNTAHYLLLIFALSIGAQADFKSLIHLTTAVLPYCSLVIGITLLLHYALSKLAGLDRDISILASTAAVFGPAFVGPVAERLKAPHLILNGMFLGMLGYAIGNFIGIGLARLLVLF